MSSKSGVPGLEVLIQSILDSKGFDELKQKMGETGQASGEMGQKFSESLSELPVLMGEVLGVTLSLAAAMEFLSSSFEAAVEGSRQLNQMAVANEVLGGATKESREENERWIKSVEDMSGVTTDQLIPGYRRLIAVTGDVSTAQRLLQTAAEVQKAGLGEAGEAVQVMIQYMESGKTMTRGFGAVLKSFVGDAKDTTEGLERFRQKVHDVAQGVDNAGLRVDQAKVQWEHMKEAVGETFLVIAEKLEPALAFLARRISDMYAVVQLGLIAPFKVLNNLLGTVGMALYNLATGHFKQAWQVIKDGANENTKIWSDAFDKSSIFMDKMAETWKKDTAALNKDTEKLILPHTKVKGSLKDIEDEYAILLSKARASAEGQIDALLKVAAIYRKMADDPRLNGSAGEKIRVEALEKSKAALVEVGNISAREAAEEIAADDKAHKAFVKNSDDWFKREHKKLIEYRKNVATRLRLAADEARAMGKSAAEATRLEIAAYEAATADFMVEEDKRTEYALKAAQLRMNVNQMEMRNIEGTLTAVVGYAQEAFGASKGMAIAQALINTYLGAARALADYQYPYSIIVAALAIASGIAQVAKISSTEPKTGGSGFDDASNDFASYIGGQRWARDMVDEFSGGATSIMRGFAATMATQPTTSVTNNVGGPSTRSAHYHIQMSGLFDSSSDIAMRRFARGLRVMNTLEDHRTLR